MIVSVTIILIMENIKIMTLDFKTLLILKRKVKIKALNRFWLYDFV